MRRRLRYLSHSFLKNVAFFIVADIYRLPCLKTFGHELVLSLPVLFGTVFTVLLQLGMPFADDF